MGKGWYLQVCHHVADLPRRTQAFKPQENPNLTLNTPRVVEDVGLHTGVQSFSGWWFLQYFFFLEFSPLNLFLRKMIPILVHGPSPYLVKGVAQLNSTQLNIPHPFFALTNHIYFTYLYMDINLGGQKTH